MINLIQLSKACFAHSLNFRRGNKRKLSGSANFIGQLFVGVFIALVFCLTYLTNLKLAFSSGDMEALKMFASISLTMFVLYGLFMTSSISISLYYDVNDAPFLCLPISGFELFLARFLLSSYISFIYGGFAIITCSIATCFVLSLSAFSYIVAVVSSLLVVLLISFLSFMLDMVFAKLLRLKGKKNGIVIFATIVSLLGAGCLIVTEFIAPSLVTDAAGSTVDNSLIYSAYQYLKFIVWIGEGLYLINNLNWISLVLLLLVFAACLALCYFLANAFYIRSLSSPYSKKKKNLTAEQKEAKLKRAFSKKGGSLGEYVSREFSNLKSAPVVLISSICIFLSLGLSLLISVFAIPREELGPLFFVIIHSFLMFSFYFPFLSYSMVSLEGKSFIYLKSMPISYKKLVIAKMIPGLFLSLVFDVTMSLIYLGVYSFSYEYWLTVIFTSVTYTMASSALSSLCGTAFANFNYSTPAEIVQRGKGPLIVSVACLFLPCIALFCDLIFAFNFPNLIALGVFVSGIIYLGLALVFFKANIACFKKLINKEF